ncbi:CatB-related O-acetyltransferase [Thermodesulfobacteriota bacterium]
MNLELQKRGIYIAPNSRIQCPFTIGDYSRINGPIYARGVGQCEIGRYCAFGEDIRIITSGHEMDLANIQLNSQRRHGFRTPVESRGGVKIGNNVWIGDLAIILYGTNIGDGAVIGAGAVVSKDIPPFSVAVGSPIRILKKRFSDNIISQLKEIQWWNWDNQKIAENRVFFETNLSENPQLNLYDIIVP